MKYLIFLDMDGVLASSRVHFSKKRDFPIWTELDPVAVAFLDKINEKYDDVSIVFTSTWKNYLEHDGKTTHLFHSMLATAGYRGKLADVAFTNHKGEIGLTRGTEVKNYLESLGDKQPKDFIIIDDNVYDFDELFPDNFIQTDAFDGMLFDHMRTLWDRVSNWDYRE